MYLDCLVKVPEIPGKIVYKKKGPSTYVLYENGRSYDPKKRFNQPKRVIIGKLSGSDKSMMQPNTGYLEQFPYAELPDEKAEPLERKQNKVINAKATYEAEVEKLEKLFEKRDAIRKE